jgi:hypothetical protein
MAIENLAFVPEQGYKDEASYPNPPSGTVAREQLMDMPFQLRDYINTTILGALNAIFTVDDPEQPSKVGQYLQKKADNEVEWAPIANNAASWGAIQGAITNQTDLMDYIGDIPVFTSNATFEIASDGWSEKTTEVGEVEYYTYNIAIESFADSNPIIGIGASNSLPTPEQQAAYAMWDFATLDDEASTEISETGIALTLYAETKPTDTFYIVVKGVVAAEESGE